MTREEQLIRVIFRLVVGATALFFLVMCVVWWSSYQGRVDLRNQIIRGCELRNQSATQGVIHDCARLYKHPTVIQLH